MQILLQNSMRAHLSRSSAAYTLLELLIVLAIVALVASIGLSAFGTASSARLNVRSAASEMVAALRDSHAQAVRDRRNVYLHFDIGGRSWRLQAHELHLLPADMTAVVTGTTQASEDLATVDIGFFPNGGSTGGKIVLSSSNENAVITVDWLTGNITWTQG